MKRSQATLDPIMTVREVAEFLRVHPSMLYKLIRKRELPAFKVGGDYRFSRDSIEKWIADKIDHDKDRLQDRST